MRCDSVRMATGDSVPVGGGQRLVGRDADLDRLSRLLDQHQLVTVAGVGGVGKTSLAAAAAHRRPADHVVFCSLGDVDTGEAVRHLVAARLGTVLSPGVPLGRAVPPTPDGYGLLVLLDNCEHVLDAAAEVADELCTAGAHVTVLTTSREPLRIAAEHVVVLGPLTVPGAEDQDAATRDAVVLFAHRARAARDDFVLDEGTLPHVADICRALDGLPLALEIAAARVRSLAVRDIAERLGERFTLLSVGARRGPARHRGLRSVVAWSYDLLGHDERALFDELSVYPSCDLRTATAAAGSVGIGETATFDVLDGLVLKSLLVAETAEATRYRMLETVRAFGTERLRERAELAAARDRHADHYAALADELRLLGLSEWSTRGAALFIEFDNIRAALEWTLERDETPDRSLRLLAPLWYVGLQYYSQEIADLVARALARWPDSDDPLHAEVRATAAACHLAVEDTAGATRLATEAIEAGTSHVAAAWGNATLAGVALHSWSDPEAALRHLALADDAAAAAGFEPMRCDLLGRRTAVLVQAGRRDDALENARRALALAEQQGNVFEHAWDLHVVGQLLAATEPAVARTWLDRALDEALRSGYPYGTASSLRALGVAATELDEPREAARRLREALDRFIRSGFRLERWNTLAAALPLLVRTGRHELAEEVAEAIERSGVVVERIAAPGYDAARSRLRPRPGAPRPVPDADRVLSRVRAELRAIADGVVADGVVADAAGAEAADRTAVVPQQRAEPRAELRRTGALWSASFDGRTAHLPDLKGLADLAVLLAHPGREVAALDLVAGDVTGAATARRDASDELTASPGDLGEQLDTQARAAYAARIRELQEELDDADAAGDPERAARAQQELDTLTRHLAAAYGLHGPRRTGDPAEKARTTVTARIRAALAKVTEVHPELGRHLRHSVRTGRFCVYRPDEPVTWHVHS